QGVAHAVDAGAELTGVAAELLAQGHGHRVHEVGPAGLDQVTPRGGAGFQRGGQRLERGHQVRDHDLGGGHVCGGGEGVVGRLRHVDVVVRVDGDALGGAQRGDDLVGVHV